MRTSTNQFSKEGTLVNGFDYKNQAWVINGLYQDCGHPEAGTELAPFPGLREEPIIFEGCNCYGRGHVGEQCTTDLVGSRG